MKSDEFKPPTREHLMLVRALADDPCECPGWVKVLGGEVSDAKLCRPCRARKALSAIRELAEEGW